jgi:hypothetical protein
VTLNITEKSAAPLESCWTWPAVATSRSRSSSSSSSRVLLWPQFLLCQQQQQQQHQTQWLMACLDWEAHPGCTWPSNLWQDQVGLQDPGGGGGGQYGVNIPRLGLQSFHMRQSRGVLDLLPDRTFCQQTSTC